MKQFLLLSFSVFLFSCSSTKKVVKKCPKQDPKTVVASPPTVTPPPVIQEEVKVVVPNNEEMLPPKTAVTPEKFNHAIFDMLLEENVSNDGRTNYKGFIKNKNIFKQYLQSLSNNMPDETWSKDDKFAYWMNAYNAFTIKLIIDNYPTQSIKDIKDAWNTRFFKLGSKWYNLSEIEHKILRKMGDPRIHFGINCASFSCPPLLNGAFTAATVNSKLDFLAHQFVNDPLRNKITENRIQLSKIFQWYGKDFKTQGSLIDFLNKYSEITINKNAKKSYLKYNWNLNE